MKDGIGNDIGAQGQATSWLDIDWQLADRNVKNLRQRIYRATQQQQWNKVRNLMKLMLRSYSNLLVAVRRVTQASRGKRTAGVDKQLVLTPKGRMRLVRAMLEHKLWQAQPVRRVYIPKAGGKRPLGIPTIKNRVAQAIVKNALEPSWEARFEPNSYGFRPGRSCHDAAQQCWNRLKGRGTDRWVLDADVKAAFDRISHDFILEAIGKIPARELIRQWLKAGYVEGETWHATTSGVPQGGVISPLLSNIALDGMERHCRGKFGYIRYADDFVLTARRKEDLEMLMPHIEDWLKQRGMVLNAEKTRIISIDDGFDFLGFNVRRYHGKCLLKPQKEKVLGLLREIRRWLKSHRQTTEQIVVKTLNPILRGWANYYRHVSSKDIFSYVDSQIWRALWRWALRRHPTKGKDWIKQRYFTRSGGRAWRFRAKYRDENGKMIEPVLINLSTTKIIRHIKVRGTSSPDDPDLVGYWTARTARVGESDLAAVSLDA